MSRFCPVKWSNPTAAGPIKTKINAESCSSGDGGWLGTGLRRWPTTLPEPARPGPAWPGGLLQRHNELFTFSPQREVTLDAQ